MLAQRSPVSRRAAALAVAAAGWLGLGVVAAAPASAHAELVASSPADLQILDAPPRSVVLLFDEEVVPLLSSVRVVEPGHAPVRTEQPTHGTQGSRALVVPITGRLTPGDYAVVWRAVSVDDGHATSGSLSFRTLGGTAAKSGNRPASVAPGVTAPRVVRVDTGGGRTGAAVYGVARWLAFLAFAAMVGAAYLRASCRRGGYACTALRRVVLVSWTLLLGSSAIVLLSYGAYVEGGGWRDLVDPTLLSTTLASRAGVALLARIGLLILIAALAVALERARRSGPATVRGQETAVLGGAALLAGTWSVVSHSASGTRPGPFMLIDVTHLVATALWVGGLVAIAVTSSRRADPIEATQLTRRFSTTAAGCVVVLVGTGLVQSWRRVGSLAALADNDYAKLLLVKVSLVGATLLVAAVTRHFVLRRRASVPRGPRVQRSFSPARGLVVVEAVFGLVVLAITSLLVTTEPAKSAHEAIVAARERTSAGAQVREVSAAALPRTPGLAGKVPYDAGVGSRGTGSVEVSVLSTRPGPTEIHFTVLDAAGVPRALARIAVALRQSGGSGQALTVRVRSLGRGHYESVGASLPRAGHWQLGMALGLPGGATAIAIAALDVQ